VPGRPISQAPLLGAFFLLTAIAVIGLPPLSGFIGKLMILDATLESPQVSGIWFLVLATSLLMTIAFARAGSLVFWKCEGPTTGPTWTNARVEPLVVVGFLIGTTVALSVLAGPAVQVFEATAKQALDPAHYIEAVLGDGGVSQAEAP
jgi:multicomponent K+:H+ antiporter subunit D